MADIYEMRIPPGFTKLLRPGVALSLYIFRPLAPDPCSSEDFK